MKPKYDTENYKHSVLTKRIISEFYHVYNALGHGFLEKVYENALYKRLCEVGFFVQKQHPVNVLFEGVLVGEYFADLIVDEKVIIEIKAVETLHPAHEVQLVNYLKATEIEVGLLVNFGETLKIKRKVFSNKNIVKSQKISASNASDNSIKK